MDNLGHSLFKGLLQVNRTVYRTTIRNKNRINVQKPRPPHYERQKFEALVKPRYFEKGERESWFLPRAYQCLKEEELLRKKQRNEVDNPYEKLIAKDLRNWFLNSKLIAFFHANPSKFDARFETEVSLRKENMYLKTWGKHTVKMAIEGTKFLPVMELFQSHTHIVFCSEPKVERLLKVAKKMHDHVLLAAVVEDRFMSVSQLKALSQYKDLSTARAHLVSVLNSAQSQLVSSLTHHQTTLVAGLAQYAEGQTESSSDPDPLSETPQSS